MLDVFIVEFRLAKVIHQGDGKEYINAKLE